jgi:2-dehydro-3-deoxyphosphogluconate aldolase / (4S)-4-hydroxy-2-oxoglutarate aldolase
MDAKVLDTIHDLALLPICTLADAGRIRCVAKVLEEERHPLIEITLRTGAAFEALAMIRGEFPGFLRGAGTVLSTELADKAIGAGAQFIVTPGFNPKVVDYCLDRGIPVIPGVHSPTEMEWAVERNLNVLKFFPAEASGGLAFLKAVSAPFPGLSFVATGGVNLANLKDYLSYGRIWACGGSFMASQDLIDGEREGEIRASIRRAISIMLGFSVESIGTDRDDLARAFRPLFTGGGKDRERAVTVKTLNLERTGAFLARQGISFDRNGGEITLGEKADGLRVRIIA